MRRPLQFLALLFASVLPAAAQSGPRPNVLLIVTDDQRPDTIRALGNPYIDTPNLDRLVARGAAFTRALVANPHCTPSRAEIMTGASGFRNESPPFGRVINPRMVLWADTMRRAGYHTWYSGKWMNDGSPKTRGYEETSGLYSSGAGGQRPPISYPKSHNGQAVTGYTGWTFKTDTGEPELEKGVGLTPLTDRHIADGALVFLQRRTDRPFFLHVNFTGPHDPLHLPPGFEKKYDPATVPLPANYVPKHPFDHGYAGGRDEQMLPVPRPPLDVKREIAAYYAVVSNLDEQVGRLLDALRPTGREDNTVIIFTSDHGLAMGSHGLMGKQNLYEHTIGVPLVIAGPGLPINQRFAAQTYLRDLYTTVCDFAGIPIPETVEGRSLVPVLAGLTREIYPEVYAYWHREHYGTEMPIIRMVRTERWKMIYYSHVDRHQLFDLANDPHELKDLSNAPAYQNVRATLQHRLDDWFGPRIAPYNHPSEQPGVR